MLGTPSAAGALAQSAQKVARNCLLPLEAVLGSYRQLIGAGFHRGEVARLFQAFADVSAFNGNDPKVIDRFTNLFAEVREKGVLELDKLHELIGASGGVLDKNTVMQNIADNLAIGVDDIAAAFRGGEVTASSGLNAVLRAIQSQSGGQVGLGMLRQADSLGGLIARLVDLKNQMIFSLDLGHSAGFQALQGTLKNILSLFDEADGAGQRVQASLLRAFDDLFFRLVGDLSGGDGRTKLEEVLSKVLSNVEFFWDAFLAGIDGVKAFIQSFFAVLDPTGKKDFTALSETLKMIGSALGAVAAQTIDILISLYNVFLKISSFPGFSSLLARDHGKVQGERSVAAEGVNAALGNGFFGNIAQMGMQGIHGRANGGVVDRPTLTLMGEDGPEAIVPLTKSYGQGLSRLSGNSPVTVNVSIALDAHGNDDGDSLAQRIAAALPSAIADALEKMALESQGAF